jgi:hypothetical protein
MVMDIDRGDPEERLVLCDLRIGGSYTVPDKESIFRLFDLDPKLYTEAVDEILNQFPISPIEGRYLVAKSKGFKGWKYLYGPQAWGIWRRLQREQYTDNE